MSQAANAAQAPAPKKKGKLLVIAGIVVVLLAGGGGAAAFFMKKGDAHAEAADADEDDGEHDAKAAKKKKKKKADGAPVFVTLEPFTVNLADTETDRLAQVAVVFEAGDKKIDEAIKAQMPAVRNAILLLLSSKTGRELLTLEGKEKLAAQIAETVNKRLDDGAIEAVHFSQFIVQ